MLRIIATAALAIASPAVASSFDGDWFEFETTDTGSRIYIYAPDSLQGMKANARVWVRIDAGENYTLSFKEARTLYQINCHERTYRRLSATYYDWDDSTRAAGADYETHYATPESNIATVIDLTCAVPSETR